MEGQITADTVEMLLDELDNEREKFTKADKQKMQEIIERLVNANVYPVTSAMKKHGYNAMTMVESYGARWHIWKQPLQCPHCSTDLRDYESGPPFKREIAIYSRELDRTTHFECPDCHKQIAR